MTERETYQQRREREDRQRREREDRIDRLVQALHDAIADAKAKPDEAIEALERVMKGQRAIKG